MSTIDNLIITGKSNNFRVNMNNLAIRIEAPYNPEGLDGAPLPTPVLENLHVVLSFANLNITYKLDNKPERDFMIKKDVLELPWIERIYFNELIIKREHVNSTTIEIALDEKVEASKYEFVINGDKFHGEGHFIAQYPIIKHSFVKTCLEFDDLNTNCIEIGKYEASIYLVDVTKIDGTRDVSAQITTPKEFDPFESSFYIKFMNEKGEMIDIDSFLINFKFISSH